MAQMELDEQETIMRSSHINFLFGAGLYIDHGNNDSRSEPRF